MASYRHAGILKFRLLVTERKRFLHMLVFLNKQPHCMYVIVDGFLVPPQGKWGFLSKGFSLGNYILPISMTSLIFYPSGKFEDAFIKGS
jgi:hypothetical protein